MVMPRPLNPVKTDRNRYPQPEKNKIKGDCKWLQKNNLRLHFATFLLNAKESDHTDIAAYRVNIVLCVAVF